LNRKITSEKTLTKFLMKNGLEELDNIITKLKSSSNKTIEINNHKANLRQVLYIAQELKGKLHREMLDPHEQPDYLPITKKLNFIDPFKSNLIFASPMPGPIPWNYSTAQELVSTCPLKSEITQIRKDFNIYFENGLVTNGVLVPWGCTYNGHESSIMLSMYNIFRLLKCIPFDKNFPWAPAFNNLYEWLKSLNLISIGFFWAQQNQNSSGWDKRIYLKGNNLADPIYREIINPQSGVGIIHCLILLVHEARHAGYNIPHNCGVKDTNLAYMGAWGVQYHLLKTLAQNTDNFFSNYEKSMFLGDAQHILTTRFCNQPP
jgi:hypothetical protein